MTTLPMPAVARHSRFDRTALFAVSVSLGLFVGMQLMVELGRTLGRREVAIHGPDALAGIGDVANVVYSLLALLVGFAFSGAAARFDKRRSLVVDEVGSIDQAWKRTQTLGPEDRAPIQRQFTRWFDLLLAWYAQPNSIATALHEPRELADAQRQLWESSVRVCLTPSGEQARMLLLPALNEMFLRAEHERLARRIHLPVAMLVMLIGTALLAALFAGYSLAGASIRNWTYTVGIAGTFAFGMFVILELEFPRAGLIRMTRMDRALTELRERM